MQQTPGIEITASRGIHSVSYSVIPRGNCVDVPLGCSVVRWDLQQRQQVAVLAQLESVVTSVVASPCGTMVATSTYDGWVSLFSTQEGEAWKLLSQTKAPTPPVKHAVFSHDSRHLAVVASGRNDYRPSVLVVWEIHDGQLKQCFQLQGTNFRCEFINNEELLCWRDSPAQLAVVSLVSGEDVRTLTMPQPSLDWQSGYAVDSELHLVAVAQKGRHVSVVDTTSLAIVDSFVAPGSGSIYTMLWWADSLVVYEGGGEYAVLSISGERVNSFSGPSHPSHLCWHVRDFMLSVATPEALSLLKVRLHSPQREHDARLDETAGHKMSVDDLSLSFHALGCCGVCFDPTGFFAVAGDLQGNLIVWSATQSEPICRVRVPVGVRSLSWQHGAVFVGCFDGALYRWVPDANALARAALGPQQGEEPGDDDDEADAHAEGGSLELVALLSSCITCMEWHHDLLALGTTDGRVTVLHHDKTRSASHLAIRNCFLAHAPVQSSDAEFVERFGSLHLKADIWGITWSPDGTMIGTSSEDQSTRIWDLEGKLLQTLTGHTLAVTCVDWKLLHSGSSLLATASDDRQVQLWLWDGSSFELSAVIHTDAVDGWFTLTYLTVLPNGHIVAGTENGHVLIWSADGTLLDHRRVHGASIEGMSYSPVSQLVVTCASDCTLAFVRAHA